jgi:leukotriene-A4 hydrolase
MAPITDPNTLSNHHSVVTQSTHVDVTLDFESSIVSGNVTLTLKALEDGVGEVVLDTSCLDIGGVAVNGKEAAWTLEDRIEPYGSALKICLDEQIKAGETVKATVGNPSRCYSSLDR